jgi:hypothetical protein
MDGCELCGVNMTVWRGGVEMCRVCMALYDRWADGRDPRPSPAAFVVEALLDRHGGNAMAAARARSAAGGEAAP